MYLVGVETAAIKCILQHNYLGRTVPALDLLPLQINTVL